MTRPLELRIDGNSKGAGAALEAASREMDKAAREADKLGRAFDEAKHDAEQLDRELVRNAAAVKLLAKEYASADKEIREDIKKRLDAERSAGNEIRKVRSEVLGDTEKDSKAATAAFALAAREWNKIAGKAEKDTRSALDRAVKDGAKSAAEAGTEAASAFADGFSGLLKNPVILGIGASLAALLAIPIGATIGGLTLAGAGIGGAAAAGLAGSKADHSGQVAAGGKDLVASINAQFLKGGDSAVEPLIKGIHELQIAVDNIHLDRIIQDSAQYIQPLAAAAGRFAEYLSEAADVLVRNAGPEVQAIADGLPEIGRAIKEFATDVSSGSQGGADALKDLFDAIAHTLIGLGKFIGFAENAYHALKQFGDGVTEVVDKFAPFSPMTLSASALLALFGQNANDASAYAVKLGHADVELDSTLQDLHRSLNTVTLDFGGLVDKQVSAREAAIAYEQSLDDLKSSIDAHSHSTDINTEAGRKNASAVDDLITKAREHRQALLDQGKSLAEADAAYDSDIGRVKALLKQLGFTNAQIATLIGLADHIPKGIKINVSAPGLSSTLGMLGQLKNLSRQIGSIVVAAGIGHRAAGGPVMKGQPYRVGERGEELFVPGENGSIVTAADTARLMNGRRSIASTMGAGEAASKSTGLTINFAGNTNSAFATAFMRLVRNGDIQLSSN